jgi:hypothetical protein
LSGHRIHPQIKETPAEEAVIDIDDDRLSELKIAGAIT